MKPLALCEATEDRHRQDGCWWVDDDEQDAPVSWSVFVVDGVAYTFTGTVGEFLDELEAA